MEIKYRENIKGVLDSIIDQAEERGNIVKTISLCELEWEEYLDMFEDSYGTTDLLYRDVKIAKTDPSVGITFVKYDCGILDKIDEKRLEASDNGKKISQIELSKEEWREFCAQASLPDRYIAETVVDNFIHQRDAYASVYNKCLVFSYK